MNFVTFLVGLSLYTNVGPINVAPSSFNNV